MWDVSIELDGKSFQRILKYRVIFRHRDNEKEFQWKNQVELKWVIKTLIEFMREK